jgi:hypothetical protein
MDEQIASPTGWRQTASVVARVVAMVAAVVIAVLLACNMFFGWLERVATVRTFSYVVEKLTEKSGWEPNLVKAGVTLLMVPYILAVFRLARLDLPLLRWLWNRPQMPKWVAQAIIAIGTSGYFLALSFSAQGSNINRWYVIDADYRVHYAYHGGVDSHTLLPLQPVTAAMVPVLDRIEAGERPKDISGDDPNQLTFFSAATPTALVWYCDCRHEERAFFNLPGFDRMTGAPLKPVDAIVVNDWRVRWSAHRKEPPASVASSNRAAGTDRAQVGRVRPQAPRGIAPVAPRDAAPGSPQAVVSEFLSAARSRNFAGAYNYLHAALKESCTPQRFISMAIAGNPRLLDIQGTSLDKTSFDGDDTVTVSGWVTLMDGSRRPARFTLSRERGAWRLVSYSVGV